MFFYAEILVMFLRSDVICGEISVIFMMFHYFFSNSIFVKRSDICVQSRVLLKISRNFMFFEQIMEKNCCYFMFHVFVFFSKNFRSVIFFYRIFYFEPIMLIFFTLQTIISRENYDNPRKKSNYRKRENNRSLII